MFHSFLQKKMINQKKLSSRAKLKKLLALIRYDKKNWWIYLLSDMFDAFQAIFMIQIVALIVGAVEEGNTEKLYYYTWWWWGIAILILVNSWVSNISHDKQFITIRSYLTQEYAKKFLDLDNTVVEGYGIGKGNSIFVNGIYHWVGLIGETVISVLVEVWAIIYAFILVATQLNNWKYFLIFLGVFFVVVGFIIWAFVVIHKYRKQAKQLTVEQDRWLIRFLMSKFEILQNNRLVQEQKIIHDLNMQEKKVWIKGDYKKLALQNTGMAILSTLRILIFVIVGVGVISGQYQLAYFVLLVELMRIMNTYIWNIRNYMKQYTKSIVHVDKMREFFETIPSREYSTWKDFTYKNWAINLENINFSYQTNDQNKSVFKDFTIQLQWGKKTALVWPSGGGKTTLVKLLAGYIFPQSWSVQVDDQDLNEVKLTDYYKHIWYLTQEPNVFDGTIRENLLYWIQYAYDEHDTVFKEQLERVIQDSRCEFIYDFKDWLDTEIWERGVRLSWWQKQRLAIAKIMLKNPNIILLDEPTSALDSMSEQKISEALHNLFKWKTVIIVAHRLQTVKEADEIIVLQEWKIIERGTHTSLKKKNWVYKQMLDLQTSF